MAIPPVCLNLQLRAQPDGTGTATVAIVATKAGEQDYEDPADSTETIKATRIHAGDGGNYLEFTYKPGQTIEEGKLKFTAAAGWSKPQRSDPGAAGYTRVVGGEPPVFAEGESDLSLTVDITQA